jgi:hypothetical protein
MGPAPVSSLIHDVGEKRAERLRASRHCIISLPRAMASASATNAAFVDGRASLTPGRAFGLRD